MSFEVDTEAMLMNYPQDSEENEYRFIDPAWLDAIAAGLTAGAVKHPGGRRGKAFRRKSTRRGQSGT